MSASTESIVVLAKVDVPSCLRDSPLFATFDDTDHSGFTIPADCIKADTSIQNTAEFVHLLNTLRHWMSHDSLQNIPDVNDYALDMRNCADLNTHNITVRHNISHTHAPPADCRTAEDSSFGLCCKVRIAVNNNLPY